MLKSKGTSPFDSRHSSILLVTWYWGHPYTSIAQIVENGTLYFLNVIDLGIVVIISLAFSVCDLICILFFCPFQTWMMHNRCCTTCRIYNWDFAMMFTPLIFIVVVPYGENGYLDLLKKLVPEWNDSKEISFKIVSYKSKRIAFFIKITPEF